LLGIAYLYYVMNDELLTPLIMTSYKNNPRYSSINLEEAGIFKGGKSKPVSVRSGAPTISKFGFTFSFRTKPQYREILNFIKVYKSEGSVIDSILNEFSPRQAGIKLRVQYNFSNTILKSII
jgi:hypothetical protein